MTSVPGEILAGTAAKSLELGRLDLAQTIAELALSEDGGCANVHSVLAVICKRSRNGSGDWSSAVVAWS